MGYERMTLRKRKPVKKFNVSIKPRRSTPNKHAERGNGNWGRFRRGPVPFISPSTPQTIEVELAESKDKKGKGRRARKPEISSSGNPRVDRPVTPKTSKTENDKAMETAAETAIKKSEKRQLKRQRHAKLNMKNKKGQATMRGKSELLLQQIEMSMN